MNNFLTNIVQPISETRTRSFSDVDKSLKDSYIFWNLDRTVRNQRTDPIAYSHGQTVQITSKFIIIATKSATLKFRESPQSHGSPSCRSIAE